MSDKLTKEILDALIQEALLQEKYQSKSNATPEDFLKDIGVSKTRKALKEPGLDKTVKPMRSLESPTTRYTANDVVKALSNPKDVVRKAAQDIVRTATSAANPNQEFVNDLKNEFEGNPEKATDARATAATGSIDIESFSFPRPFADLSAVTQGKFLQSQNDLINSVFDQPDIKSRLVKLSDISTALNKNVDKISNMNKRDLLQYTMAADIVDMFMNQLDQRNSGYLFESFLANLVGGKVVGGENGIADFETGGGQDGSAKLYGTWSLITQNFGKMKLGDSVHYVIGIHGAGQEETRKKVDLYYAVVTLAEQNQNGKLLLFSDADGNKVTQRFYPKGTDRFDLTKVVTSGNKDVFYIGSFELARASESYKDRLDNIIGDTSIQTDSKKALSAMKSFFSQLYKAEEKTKSYVAQKENTNPTNEYFDNANAALKEYDAADGFLVTLLNLLSPNREVKDAPGGGRELKENKMTKLDLMIENMVKQFIKGELDD
jgi:hypothetical protein